MTRHSCLIFFLALILLCGALYAVGLDGPFLFDSKVALLKNPDFHLDPTGFTQWWLAVVSSGSGPLGRPVSMLSFAVNFVLGGADSAFQFKLGNLVVHGLCGLLVWRVLLRLLSASPALNFSQGQARAVALTTMALWLLHPLQVSTVLYSVQRMEQLSTLFTLLGLFAYLHFRVPWLERRATAAELSNGLLAVVVCLLLAIFSKEDGVLLLPLLVLLEIVLLRGTYDGAEQRGLQFLCGASLVLGLLLLVALAVGQPGWLVGLYEVRDFSLSERLWTQSRVLWQYLGWIAVPDIRSMGLHHDDVVISQSLWQPLTTVLSLLAWLALLAAAFLGWRRWPLYSFCLGWFLLVHMLESSLLPLEMVYEHRNYLPMLGVCLFLAWLIWVVLPLKGLRQRLALAAVLLLVLSLQLAQRASLWGNEEKMAAYHLRHHPQSLRAVYHYANVQLRLGQAGADRAQRQQGLQLARNYYQHMLELDPQDLTALVTLLYLDDRFFRSLESESWRTQLIALAEKQVLSPADGNALEFLSRCQLAGSCKMPTPEFEGLMLRLAQRFPRVPTYHVLLARHAGELLEDFPRAIGFHQQALRRSPGFLPARSGLIQSHLLAGEQATAIEGVRDMLQRDSSIVPLRRALIMLDFPES